MPTKRLLLVLLSTSIAATSLQAARIKPKDGVEYTPMFPKKWEAKGLESPHKMTAWKGKNVALLTIQNDHDPKVMTPYVANLDKGWETYEKITGREPRPFKMYQGKPILAAVPSPAFSCGAGCGYVGSTGIELGLFYTHDLEHLKKDTNAVPHYVYYEMGRNFYTYGDKHSYFATGFAVFMRYVCVDQVKSSDLEPEERKKIAKLESHANDPESTLTFVDIFTHVGHEKRAKHSPKLKISQSNNSNYASVMLYLRKNYGGDEWVKRFYHTLDTAEPFSTKEPTSAYRQSLSWLVCASIAAKKDLTPLFMKRYKLAVSKEDQALLKKVNWRRTGLKIAPIVKRLAHSPPETQG